MDEKLIISPHRGSKIGKNYQIVKKPLHEDVESADFIKR
jgi:hypothetical protein